MNWTAVLCTVTTNDVIRRCISLSVWAFVLIRVCLARAFLHLSEFECLLLWHWPVQCWHGASYRPEAQSGRQGLARPNHFLRIIGDKYMTRFRFFKSKQGIAPSSAAQGTQRQLNAMQHEPSMAMDHIHIRMGSTYVAGYGFLCLCIFAWR